MQQTAKYNRRAKFYSVTIARDAAGIEKATPELICETFCSVQYGSSADRRVAAGTEAGQAVTVRVRSNAPLRSVDVLDRVEIRGDPAIYAIEGIAPIGRGEEIEFTGMSAKGAGA